MKRPLRAFDIQGLHTRLLSVFLLFFCAILAGGLISPGDAVFAAQPLLQEGKRTVFQRVVSNPGAVLYADPEGQIAAEKPRTFTSFYVYARKEGMLRVGVSTTEPQGWLREKDATEWPQAITMVFTDQMGREPVLFFKSHKDLEDLCAAESIKDTVAQYVTLFSTKNARVPKDCPVIATEPLEKDGQISQKDFYLLPVLTVDTQFTGEANGMQLLEVACLDPGVPNAEQKKESAEPRSMRTGIVFVVDTTISMKPYIEQTKEIIRNIFDRIQNSPIKDSIAFAVIAFRSNPQIRPKTEYNTRVISDFVSVNERDTLDKLLEQLEECRASTHAFDEDSLAGVKEAVDALSWASVDGKIILLVTDAGPLAGTDATSKTGMSPEGMADYLRTNGIFLTALHVKTPKGKNDHHYAEKSYRELSKLSNNRSSYIAIDAPNPERGAQNFQKVGMAVANIFCKIAEDQIHDAKLAKPKVHDAPKDASPEDLARHYAEVSGYAMQLQFAGNKQGTTAPSVVRAWIADADLSALEEHPQDDPVPAVYAAVLLTKMQLSQLRKQLKTIIATAEEAFLQDSENFNFYEQLISAAAQMSRDPSSFSSDPKANLAQKGVLLEVLDGLPYKSRILGLTQEDWTNMSTGEKEEFIKRLKGLVRRYEEYDRDNTHWEGFGSANPNDRVYRVPLSMLP